MTDARIPPEALAYLDEFRAFAIGDDYDRCDAVENAPKEELQRLVDAHDALPEAVWEWLANPPAPQDTPQEYYDVTDVISAAEYAKAVLDPPPDDPARTRATIDGLMDLIRRQWEHPPGQG
ncbi:MAG: hypothetical protein HZY73_16670 [Micropruina sp.]|nr:MAG: hypothetical protein HZY73_16670 [Micropruina sp.]